MNDLWPSVDLIVFTDLDATLLDEATYSWDAARPALVALAGRHIPIVLASSKTRAEMIRIARDLGVDAPLIVENGSGVLLPATWPHPPDAARTAEGWLVTLGARVEVLRPALAEIAEACGTSARGFGDMTVQEIAERTGLTSDEAHLAAMREFDEPFVLPAPGRLQCVEREAEARGLRVTRGGRFFHLTGESDKGTAVRAVLEWMGKRENRDSPRFSVGLGDSLNDLDLLRAVDQPIIVPRPDGRPDPDLVAALPRAAVAPAPGPVGWNQAILALLADLPPG